ncbi:MAG: toll/interleukin-1 receptor domain-containing protein [Acidimicrobiales bacterium]
MGESGLRSAGRIFINYRREDAAYPAGWLFDRLNDHFRDEEIFKDVDSISPGDDFVESITGAVASCDVFLAVIGSRWLDVTDSAGRRRLDDPNDLVRVEIEAALARGIRVIPVLIDGARLPAADELPAGMVPLVRRQAVELTSTRFGLDVERLLTVLRKTLPAARGRRGARASAPALPTVRIPPPRPPASPAPPPPPPPGEPTDPAPTDAPAEAEARLGGRRVAILAAVALATAAVVALGVASRSSSGSTAQAGPATTAKAAVTTPPPATAPPATTTPPTTTTTIVTSPQRFKITGTCELNPSKCGVAVMAEPDVGSKRVGEVRENQSVLVVCQAQGQLIENTTKTRESKVWDQVEGGGFISDMYVLTGADDFLPSLARCNR